MLYQIKVTQYLLSYELFISSRKPVFKSSFIFIKNTTQFWYFNIFFCRFVLLIQFGFGHPVPQYTKRARATQRAVMKIINLAKLISFSPLAKEKSQLNGYTQNMACLVMPLAKQPQPQCSERLQIVCRFLRFFCNHTWYFRSTRLKYSG